MLYLSTIETLRVEALYKSTTFTFLLIGEWQLQQRKMFVESNRIVYYSVAAQGLD